MSILYWDKFGGVDSENVRCFVNKDFPRSSKLITVNERVILIVLSCYMRCLV